MFENEMVEGALNFPSSNTYNTAASEFREERGITSAIAYCFGAAIIGGSIILGRSYAFYISFMVLSVFITILWRKNPRPLINLTAIAAGTPIALFKQNIACNLIFAFWIAVVSPRYILRLPKWIYVPAALVILGIITSSINWMSGGIARSILRQGAFAYSYFFAPFIFLPLVYLRLGESRDHAANLRGLLFCLIVPSTLILITAKLFGTIANEWQASLHQDGLSQGYLKYQLGKVIVDFSRTGVGFILSALICASTAVSASQVKSFYRIIAGACLSLNSFLLLSTGSFGSIFACFCGLATIFYLQLRVISITKVLLSATVLCCIAAMIYSFSPPATKEYLEKRYEHRVVNADTDRLRLWARAVASLIEHPEGVGLTFVVGEQEKSNPHNDYLAYAVSYGIIGGLSYPFIIAGLLTFFFKNHKRRAADKNALAITLAGNSVIVAFALNSLTDNIAVNRWYFNAIWSLIWYSYFCSRASLAGNKSNGIEPEAGSTAQQDDRSDFGVSFRTRLT